MSEIRKFQKKTPKGWRTCKIASIKKGNTFRVFEPDNSIVEFNGTTEFKATKDAAICEANKCYHVTIE